MPPKPAVNRGRRTTAITPWEIEEIAEDDTQLKLSDREPEPEDGIDLGPEISSLERLFERQRVEEDDSEDDTQVEHPNSIAEITHRSSSAENPDAGGGLTRSRSMKYDASRHQGRRNSMDDRHVCTLPKHKTISTRNRVYMLNLPHRNLLAISNFVCQCATQWCAGSPAQFAASRRATRGLMPGQSEKGELRWYRRKRW